MKQIKYTIVALILLLALFVSGCVPGDPIPGDLCTQNIYPGTHNTYDIGSPSLYYNDAYFTTIHATTILSPYARFVTVAESGGDYTSIQDAIDSITDATVASVYAVYIYPGDYTETITGKDYVHLVGVLGKRSTVQIHGAAGVLLTTQTGSGGIFKNLDFVSTGAEVLNIPAGAGGKNFLFKNCRFKADITDSNLDVITVDSGKVALEDCRLSYTETNVGGTAGAVWHRGIYVNDDAIIRIHDCNLEMEVGDDDDIVVMIEEKTGVTAEMLIDSTDFHIHLTNVAYAGAAGVYYTHGSGQDRHIIGCHIHITTDGNGFGYAYFLDSTAGGGEIYSTANHILVNGFGVNGYLAAAAAGDKVCCSFDDIGGSDAGYSHSGDVKIIVGTCGTFTADVIMGGNITSLGKVEADRLIGDIEGYSIDIAQASDLNIALNDTISLSFNFEPDIIILSYSGRCQHDTTFEAGHTTGHCEIAVTGVDTINYNLNASGLRDSNGAISTVALQNSAINVVGVFGGFDGADWAMFYGVGTWTTATHTLLITFSTVDNCNSAQNFIEIMATAYR